MQTRPTEEMATHGDDGVGGHVEANVAFERRVFPIVIAGIRTLDVGLRFLRFGRRRRRQCRRRTLFTSSPRFGSWTGLCGNRSWLLGVGIVQVTKVWKILPTWKQDNVGDEVPSNMPSNQWSFEHLRDITAKWQYSSQMKSCIVSNFLSSTCIFLKHNEAYFKRDSCHRAHGGSPMVNE